MIIEESNDDAGVIPAFYRVRDVLRLTALSRSTVYRRIMEGRFPPPIHLSERVCAWPRTTLEAWIADPENYHAPQAPESAVRHPRGRPRKYVRP